MEHLIAKQLTTTSRCPPTPLTVGHAGLSPDSLQVVPLVTVVGHCGFKGSTRDSLVTICRSIRGRTTADSCREDSNNFPCSCMQCKHMQIKTSKRQANLRMHNHVSTSTQKQNRTQMHVYACTMHTHQCRHSTVVYLMCSFCL